MPQIDLRSVAGQFGPSFLPVLRSAQAFWHTHLSALAAGPDHPHILVELLTQDLRVNLRSLSLASALSVATGARIIAVVGTEPQWEHRVWTGYDAEMLGEMARAWGAVDVLDLREAVTATGSGADHLDVDGVALPVAAAMQLDATYFTTILDATGARIRGVPAMTDEMRQDETHSQLIDFSGTTTRVWEALVQHTAPIAFVTSHVDYAQWAPASIAAGRASIPTLHVQSTGGMKAYRGIDPAHPESTYRQELTRTLGIFFEQELWPRREALRPAAELVAWRARKNLGVPSWWRSESEDDEVAYVSAAERSAVRDWAARRTGVSPDRPVVVVFNHAVSDALGGNREIFDSLAQWFERTAEFAVVHPEVTWLLLDHPKQHLYDTTGFFESVATRLGHHPHLHFAPSRDFSKNELWSLADLVVTVRGSVSNEYPAYGIPAIQAGWSEWSHCGFSMRADDQDQYWQLLRNSVSALLRGSSLITDDQVERARLWMWFYRSSGDVSSGLVPHWRQGLSTPLHHQLNIAMNSVEADFDPLFTSVANWWATDGPALLRGGLDEVSASARTATSRPSYPLLTSLDEPTSTLATGEGITTGADPRLALLKGFHRSWAMVARAWKADASLAVRLIPGAAARVLTVVLQVDKVSDQWWVADHPGEEPDRERVLQILVGGSPRGRVVLMAAALQQDVPVELHLRPQDVGPSGFVVLDLVADPSNNLPDPVIGVRVERIDVVDVVQEPRGWTRGLRRR